MFGYNYSRFWSTAKSDRESVTSQVTREASISPPKCSSGRSALAWSESQREWSRGSRDWKWKEQAAAMAKNKLRDEAFADHMQAAALINRSMQNAWESPRQTNCAQTNQTKIKQKQWVRDANFYPSARQYTIKTEAACASALDWTQAKVILLFFGGGGDFFL